jgi:uncharacterized damage-inducible protein DinB
MAAYNAEMNRRLYAAAASLTDAARKADRGAFWKSIQGTLIHLYWGDCQWIGALRRPAEAGRANQAERRDSWRFREAVRETGYGRC